MVYCYFVLNMNLDLHIEPWIYRDRLANESGNIRTVEHKSGILSKRYDGKIGPLEMLGPENVGRWE